MVYFIGNGFFLNYPSNPYWRYRVWVSASKLISTSDKVTRSPVFLANYLIKSIDFLSGYNSSIINGNVCNIYLVFTSLNSWITYLVVTSLLVVPRDNRPDPSIKALASRTIIGWLDII